MYCAKCGEQLMNNDDITFGYCFDCSLWWDYEELLKTCSDGILNIRKSRNGD